MGKEENEKKNQTNSPLSRDAFVRKIEFQLVNRLFGTDTRIRCGSALNATDGCVQFKSNRELSFVKIKM